MIRNEKAINLITVISIVVFPCIIYEQIFDNLATFFISSVVYLLLNKIWKLLEFYLTQANSVVKQKSVCHQLYLLEFQIIFLW